MSISKEEEKKRPTVIKSPFILPVGTDTDTKEFPINKVGTLVAVTVLPTNQIGPFADMFIGAELSYTLQKTQLPLIRGYLKTNFSLTWFGRQPTDIETKIIIEHLNASGESQNIIVTAVLDNE